MPEPDKPSDDAVIDAHLRLGGGGFKAIWGRINWTLVAVLLMGGPQALGVLRVNLTADETASVAKEANKTAEEVKEIASEHTLPTAKEIKHELSNGLADRIANKVNANMEPRFKKVESDIKAIREFLVGEAGLNQGTNAARTALKPAG